MGKEEFGPYEHHDLYNLFDLFEISDQYSMIFVIYYICDI